MFHLFLITHIHTGAVCLVSGLVAMASSKKRGRHTAAGEIYHGAYVIVFISAIVMSIIHWEESAYLFYIGVFSYSLALLGYAAAKRRWKNWMGMHIGGMLGSYIGIITATIVVNISKVPVLSEIPVILFWFLPTLIGTPLIIRAGKKYTPKRDKGRPSPL
ncbi:alcohol dehydrogenase [Mesobacillus campisalis]|uniref:Alcohol dehydrogenase n=1 Tax=Mesobacillus campisalis TaxID=1408103 RepID=A0A0M2SYV6_9BACI|nr:hypothetical protein [Mesobacillus campisalis]KKK38167.1 alcohol dehydrogenase [Mesobacillus campisalis]